MGKKISFASVVGDIAELFDANLDRYSFEKEKTTEERIFGRFEYESEPLFGSPTSLDGPFVYDKTTSVIGLVQESDRPKPGNMFEKLSESEDLSIVFTAPQYTQEAIKDFYETYGMNGYTTSFRENIREYGTNSTFTYIEPEEVAAERARTNKGIQDGEELLEKVVTELFEQGMYVSLMDITLEENGETLRFSSPMSISRMDSEEFDETYMNLICDRVQEILENDVKSVDEVLAES